MTGSSPTPAPRPPMEHSYSADNGEVGFDGAIAWPGASFKRVAAHWYLGQAAPLRSVQRQGEPLCAKEAFSGSSCSSRN